MYHLQLLEIARQFLRPPKPFALCERIMRECARPQGRASKPCLLRAVIQYVSLAKTGDKAIARFLQIDV